MVRFAGFSLMYFAAWPLVYALHVLARLLLALLFMYFLDYFSANIILLHFRCKCGNCNVALLQNISECYCCCELEGCEESIKSDLVLRDLAPDVNLTCITQHPGFQPVCLQKWSLRLAADKCFEHITELFDGSHWARFSLTKSIHLFLRFFASGRSSP